MSHYKSSQHPNDTQTPETGNAETEVDTVGGASLGPDAELLLVCAVQRRDHDRWVTRLAEDPSELLAVDGEVKKLEASWQSALLRIEALTPQTPLGALRKAEVARRFAAWAPFDGRAVSLLASSSEALGRFVFLGDNSGPVA